jgi:hypothetical protein
MDDSFDLDEQQRARQHLRSALAATAMKSGALPSDRGHLYEAWLFALLSKALASSFDVSFETSDGRGGSPPANELVFGNAPSNVGSATPRSHATLGHSGQVRFELHQSRYVTGQSDAPSDVDIVVIDRNDANLARANGTTVGFTSIAAATTAKSYSIIKGDAHLAKALRSDLGHRSLAFATTGTASANALKVLVHVGVDFFGDTRPSTTASPWAHWMLLTTVRECHR